MSCYRDKEDFLVHKDDEDLPPVGTISYKEEDLDERIPDGFIVDDDNQDLNSAREFA